MHGLSEVASELAHRAVRGAGRAAINVLVPAAVIMGAASGGAMGQQQLASSTAPQAQTGDAASKLGALFVQAKQAEARGAASEARGAASEARGAAHQQSSACIRSFLPQAPSMTDEQKKAAVADCRAKAGLQ